MFCLPSLGNGWADCVEVWYALGDPLVTAYAAVTGGVSLHVPAHADRAAVSRERLGQFGSILVCKFGVMN